MGRGVRVELFLFEPTFALQINKNLICILYIGGAFRSNLELQGFLTQDVKTMAEMFVKLEYSQKWIISILNRPSDEKSHLPFDENFVNELSEPFSNFRECLNCLQPPWRL